MSLDLVLRIGVVLSAFYCLTALTVLVFRTFSFRKKPLFAQSHGSATKGVVYAFGKGMLPWEKESASKHLPTFFAGILYHLGILAAMTFLATHLLQFQLSELAIQIFRVLLVIGFASGIGLLVKRSAIPYMRFISCVDDYIANMLVELLLFSALLTTFYEAWRYMIMAGAIVLLLYIPMGKIRHCFFFFYSRIIFGRFFGRRGTLPHPSPEA